MPPTAHPDSRRELLSPLDSSIGYRGQLERREVPLLGPYVQISFLKENPEPDIRVHVRRVYWSAVAKCFSANPAIPHLRLWNAESPTGCGRRRSQGRAGPPPSDCSAPVPFAQACDEPHLCARAPSGPPGPIGAIPKSCQGMQRSCRHPAASSRARAGGARRPTQPRRQGETPSLSRWGAGLQRAPRPATMSGLRE